MSFGWERQDIRTQGIKVHDMQCAVSYSNVYSQQMYQNCSPSGGQGWIGAGGGFSSIRTTADELTGDDDFDGGHDFDDYYEAIS